MEVFYSSIDYKTTEFTGSLQLFEEGEVSWVQKRPDSELGSGL